MERPAVERWEIYRIDARGSPKWKGLGASEAPAALVISNDGFNAHFDVVTVLPLARADAVKRRAYPFEVALPGSVGSSDSDRIVMPHQIRTISRSRLAEPVGVLTDPALREEIERRLLEHLGVEFEVEGL